MILDCIKLACVCCVAFCFAILVWWMSLLFGGEVMTHDQVAVSVSLFFINGVIGGFGLLWFGEAGKL